MFQRFGFHFNTMFPAVQGGDWAARDPEGCFMVKIAKKEI
jgi:hypothetical protein